MEQACNPALAGQGPGCGNGAGSASCSNHSGLNCCCCGSSGILTALTAHPHDRDGFTMLRTSSGRDSRQLHAFGYPSQLIVPGCLGPFRDSLLSAG